LVRDGDLGEVSDAQKDYLSSAMDQCECAVHLVNEMSRLRQFESGFPNVRRQWLSMDDLRERVQATLQPWALPRDIHLLWDGPFGQRSLIYGDPTLLRRLLVNLIGNAIKVTRQGYPVLIRAKRAQRGDAMVWSVVDQGTGISATDMERIASGKVPSSSNGGLGLIISRQLAAAHFSTLKIESRTGTGTAVSFQTVCGGPGAVASQWARWRARLFDKTLPRRFSQGRQVQNIMKSIESTRDVTQHAPQRVRIDIPSHTVELGVQDQRPEFPGSVVLSSVSVGAAVRSQKADRFDALLQSSMRITDFAYRADRRKWVIAWDADQQEAAARRRGLQTLANVELGDMRLTWGDFFPISLLAERPDQAANTLRVRLSDLMIRSTLSRSAKSIRDTDQVRLGTAPLAVSQTAERRLERDADFFRRDQNASTTGP
jgi:hypothetical protein